MPHPLAAAEPRQPQPRPIIRLVRDEESPAYDGEPSKKRHMAVPFARLPVAVLKNPKLSPWARLLYALLVDYDREAGCFPGQPRLAADLGVSLPTVERALAELVKAGLVNRQRRGRGHTNLYSLSYDPSPVRDQTDDPSPVTDPDPSRMRDQRPHDPSPVRDKPDNVKPDLEEPEGGTPPIPPTRASYPADFESFWQGYPTGYGNKKAAYGQWQRIKPNAALLDEIMAGLARWKASGRWQRNYIKAAEIWLRDRWWENAPPVEAAPPLRSNGHGPTGPDASFFAEWARDLARQEKKP